MKPPGSRSMIIAGIVESKTHQFEIAKPKKHLYIENVSTPVKGKRTPHALSLSLSPKEIEAAVLSDPACEKYLGGKAPRKVIVVPGKIVNVVC